MASILAREGADQSSCDELKMAQELVVILLKAVVLQKINIEGICWLSQSAHSPSPSIVPQTFTNRIHAVLLQ